MILQITIFDHRGCARVGKEYLGEKSNTQDDEMMVKVAQTQLNIASNAFTELANAVLAVCAVCTFSRCILALACRRGLSRCEDAICRATGPRPLHKWGLAAWVWASQVDARCWMAEGQAPHDRAAACWPGCSRLAIWWGEACVGRRQAGLLAASANWCGLGAVSDR